MVHSCELVSSLVVKQFDKQGDCLQKGQHECRWPGQRGCTSQSQMREPADCCRLG
jgi:hypothetical protein